MEEFDGIQFVRYVRHRGLLVATCCVTAMVLAGSVSVLLPARYTATASILIEPPAGNDPRGATAVSPVYLESLKTYERFASSDSVFATALYKAGLQQTFGGKSVESIKRSVLKVARPASYQDRRDQRDPRQPGKCAAISSVHCRTDGGTQSRSGESLHAGCFGRGGESVGELLGKAYTSPTD